MKTESGFLQALMLLSRAAQIVLQDGVLDGLRGPPLAPSKASILRVLGRRVRQSVNDLASFLGQTKAAASQHVDALARSGLVRKQADLEDRRLVWVLLTPRGKRLLEDLEARQRAALHRALQGIPAKARGQLSRGMRGLAFALLDRAAPETTSCLQCCAFDSAGCVRECDEWRCAYMLRGATARARRAAALEARRGRGSRRR
ncbi:MAG: MarR family transcriptional regulator [Planctomycetes bacterium]|nr:MarR family transcriptional regulator [Planctomycetota bacterium]